MFFEHRECQGAAVSISLDPLRGGHENSPQGSLNRAGEKRLL